MSSDYYIAPNKSLDSRRVVNPLPVDFASVEYIVSNTSIAEAWKKVRTDKGAPGVDHISIGQFPDWGRPQLKDIKKRILEGTYIPTPVLRVEIYRQGYIHQIDIGLEKFFDTVNHDALMLQVARKVKDKGLLKHIGRFLRAGVVVNLWAKRLEQGRFAQ